MPATLLERPPRTDLDIRPMTGTCGVEVLGVDLAAGIDVDTVQLVRQLLAERGVVFFRDQQLTPESHKAFAQLFGPIVTNPVYDHVPGYPEIMPVVKEPHDKYNIGDTWHSDMSYMEEPPLGSILYAREIPPFGGDTLWTNMTAAYEALPDTMKKMLDGRRALHSDRFLTERLQERNAGRSTRLREDRVGKELSALHPVVRRHDESGAPALYVNYPFTWAFEGMSREESLPLLSQLVQHATRPEFCCRFRWQKGSLAFWDNRCTMHYACNDYQGYRREMHRITVAGQRPA
ncbi:TauD/TfdA dioxygenase family protein [Pseudorhodoferax sp.]|uniref:TauD/TfdA dioxygenase family protein n=1 Tax=Pseudorhodoferax sp. TaxID=1993553 RepID=UPI002DD687D8|nr:TauD/TfdA family dioxygenase [Pseudorhodoferax sp.]